MQLERPYAILSVPSVARHSSLPSRHRCSAIPAGRLDTHAFTSTTGILPVHAPEIHDLEPRLVTLARLVFEHVSVEYCQISTAVLHHAVTLQSAYRVGDGLAANTEKMRHRLVGDFDHS